MTDRIDRFDGEHRFLSNFWPALVTLDAGGVQYPSVEHAYQAAKTLDHYKRLPFQRCTAGQAKRLGRQLTMRLDWDAVKQDVMAKLLIQKFSKPDLREKLLATGDAELVEGNTWGDTYWGVCRGRGENYLGKLLMLVRDACVQGVIP